MSDTEQQHIEKKDFDEVDDPITQKEEEEKEQIKEEEVTTRPATIRYTTGELYEIQFMLEQQPLSNDSPLRALKEVMEEKARIYFRKPSGGRNQRGQKSTCNIREFDFVTFKLHEDQKYNGGDKLSSPTKYGNGPSINTTLDFFGLGGASGSSSNNDFDMIALDDIDDFTILRPHDDDDVEEEEEEKKDNNNNNNNNNSIATKDTKEADTTNILDNNNNNSRLAQSNSDFDVDRAFSDEPTTKFVAPAPPNDPAIVASTLENGTCFPDELFLQIQTASLQQQQQQQQLFNAPILQNIQDSFRMEPQPPIADNIFVGASVIQQQQQLPPPPQPQPQFSANIPFLENFQDSFRVQPNAGATTIATQPAAADNAFAGTPMMQQQQQQQQQQHTGLGSHSKSAKSQQKLAMMQQNQQKMLAMQQQQMMLRSRKKQRSGAAAAAGTAGGAGGAAGLGGESAGAQKTDAGSRNLRMLYGLEDSEYSKHKTSATPAGDHNTHHSQGHTTQSTTESTNTSASSSQEHHTVTQTTQPTPAAPAAAAAVTEQQQQQQQHQLKIERSNNNTRQSTSSPSKTASHHSESSHSTAPIVLPISIHYSTSVNAKKPVKRQTPQPIPTPDQFPPLK